METGFGNSWSEHTYTPLEAWKHISFLALLLYYKLLVGLFCCFALETKIYSLDIESILLL